MEMFSVHSFNKYMPFYTEPDTLVPDILSKGNTALYNIRCNSHHATNNPYIMDI